MRHSRVLAVSVTMLAVLLVGITAAVAQVRVGSKNFTEQFVVAEIYAQALEAAGIKVERKLNLGGTLIAHKALEEKQIDLYPEYTGTMLLVVMKAEPMTDQKAVYDKVKADYAARGFVDSQRSPDEQHLQHGRASRNGRAIQAGDAVGSGARGEGIEARRRSRVPRSQGRLARPQGEIRHRVQGGSADGDRPALPGAGEQADRRRQRLRDRWHDQRAEAQATQGRQDRCGPRITSCPSCARKRSRPTRKWPTCSTASTRCSTNRRWPR